MTAPAELREMMKATLEADPRVAEMVVKVYDGVAPRAAATPYITIGDSQFVPDDVECIRGGLSAIDIHCWTTEFGRRTQCEQLVGAVRAALHKAELELDQAALVWIEVANARVMGDPDGTTAHGVVTVEAMVEEAA